jgi:hypothetical protein
MLLFAGSMYLPFGGGRPSCHSLPPCRHRAVYNLCSSAVWPTHTDDGIAVNLKKATCRIAVDDRSGTGLLIDGETFGFAGVCILTAQHVLEEESDVAMREAAAVEAAARATCHFFGDGDDSKPLCVRLDPTLLMVGRRDDDSVFGAMDYCIAAVPSCGS